MYFTVPCRATKQERHAVRQVTSTQHIYDIIQMGGKNRSTCGI